MENNQPPKLQRILETALYVDDMERSIHFYQHVMQLEPILHIPRLCAFSVGGISVLLIFKRGSTLEPFQSPGGIIPPHNGQGPLHMAFAIQAEDLNAWKERLQAYGVTILSEVKWPASGTNLSEVKWPGHSISLYFHDPDGHLIELATPGLWPIY